MRSLLLAAIAALVVLGAWLFQNAPSQDNSANKTASAVAAHSAATGAQSASAPLGGNAAAVNAEPRIESSLLTPAEFHELVNEVRRSLPLKSSLAKLAPAETFEHTTPAFLISAGRQLGRVAGALAKNPQLRAEAVVFYADCAGNAGNFDSVRAVCLADLDKLGGKNAQVDAPEHVQRLAARLQ